MTIDPDAYYRGQAAQRLQELGDEMLRLSQEAQHADAATAALHLADVATQLLDISGDLAGHSTARSEGGPPG